MPKPREFDEDFVAAAPVCQALVNDVTYAQHGAPICVIAFMMGATSLMKGYGGGHTRADFLKVCEMVYDHSDVVVVPGQLQ